MADDPYRYFRLEARDILDQFGAAVLELEKGRINGQVPLLLRLAHTLKGAARVVKQPEIADGAHAIEEALAPYRDNTQAPSQDHIDEVLRQLEAIDGRVGRLGQPLAAQAAAADRPDQALQQRPAVDELVRTVRADITDVDALLDSIAETHALLGGLRMTLRSVEQAYHLAALVSEQMARRSRVEALLQLGPLADGFALADDLHRGIGQIGRQLDATIDQMDRELRQSRAAAEEIRLVGVGTLFTILERTARDTAHALGKEVAFTATGGDIKLDADVLSAVQAALVQLVRNAVAHGIEAPAQRVAARKPRIGVIALDISRRGTRIVFSCRDDGAGLDLDGVRRAAQRRGLFPVELVETGAPDLIHLLLQGGLTTSDAVTEIAGRGIGLDVVRSAVERLGGTVAAATEQGRGTEFRLVVPLSLAAIDALVVGNRTVEAVLPLDAVRRTILLGADDVSHAAGGATVLDDGQAIPFLWLPQVLGGQRLPSGRKWPTVILAAPDAIAVGVDRLVGVSRAVVRPMPELTPIMPFIAGAALDAEGNPRLVLNPEGLLAEARRDDAALPEPKALRHPVLVVDDSLTTRMLEQSILESAGYEVDVATSAEEALEIVGRRRYALILVDVEMPGMDGFSFVARIRGDPALHDIPAVLVTSRASPEDRKRGRDVGASGYVVKGEFDQAELLAMIRTLIGKW